jgi:uncharacterized protein (TIGR03086 family)
MMTEPEVFVLADRTLQGVVEQIRDEQWDMTMPKDFATSAAPDKRVTLREVVNYHAYEDAWVPDMLAGRTMDEVGQEAYKGDLLGEDPKDRFAAYVDTACAAVQNLDDLERTVHCSFGDFSARDYLLQTNMFRGLRSYDIARVIGTETRLPGPLVQGLWDELAPIAEEWRAIGIFGPKIDVPEDAPLQDRLLGLTGRQP